LQTLLVQTATWQSTLLDGQESGFGMQSTQLPIPSQTGAALELLEQGCPASW
jgi:hypothetical protein